MPTRSQKEQVKKEEAKQKFQARREELHRALNVCDGQRNLLHWVASTDTSKPLVCAACLSVGRSVGRSVGLLVCLFVCVGRARKSA